MARIGLLGGTFNPPHIAHLVCAQDAHAQLGLDRVLFIPVHTPPHKDAHDDPGIEHRVELCRRAVQGDARFEVSRIEADVPGRSYTVDTLRRLHDECPEDQLTFIVGGDMARSLPAWREPEAILELAELGVAGRDSITREEIERVLAGLGGQGRARYFDMPRLDVSSTLVRARLGAGLPVRYLVPDAVSEYIEANGLYAGSVA